MPAAFKVYSSKITTDGVKPKRRLIIHFPVRIFFWVTYTLPTDCCLACMAVPTCLEKVVQYESCFLINPRRMSFGDNVLQLLFCLVHIRCLHQLQMIFTRDNRNSVCFKNYGIYLPYVEIPWAGPLFLQRSTLQILCRTPTQLLFQLFP